MTIRIRRAGDADVETLFAIRTDVTQNHMSRDDLAALDITPETVTAALSGEARAWIAEIDGEPVAFAMADNDEATVFAMFVLPRSEGRGIGRMLMAEAEAFLFKRHQTIWLNTGTGDHIRANGFYGHLGWTADGAAPDGQTRYVKTRGG